MDAQVDARLNGASGQPTPAGEPMQAVAGRLLSDALGTIDILVIALGERLGFYRLLAQREPLTPPGLAAASGAAPRYAREWLEQQAVTGLPWLTPTAAAAACRGRTTGRTCVNLRPA